MKRDYFITKDRFKEVWTKAVGEMAMDFSDEYQSEIKDKFNRLFNERYVKVYNTSNGKQTMLPALKFLNYISNNAILIEDGSLFLSHDVAESPVCKILLAYIAGRKVFKGNKLKAEETGDALAAAIFAVIELILKLVVNTFYGMSIYTSSPSYNISVGSACTCKGRTDISISALTSELLGGWRPYILDAHLKLIEKVKLEYIRIPNLGVTLEKVSVEQTLEAMLGPLYPTYPNKSVLRGVLSKLEPEVLSRIYHKNDVGLFLAIPEVDAVIRKLFYKLRNPEVKFMNVRKYSSEIKEEVELLTQYIENVLFGMYHYGGDIVNGKKYNNTVLTVKKMIRRRIALIDTDSACPAMGEEFRMIKTRFDKDIPKGNIESELYASITIAVLLYTTCVTLALNNYSGMCNIPDRFHKYIVMEDELVVEHIHLSRAMKNYSGLVILKEGFASGKVMSKGFGYKKGNFQPEMAKAAKTIVEKMIMVNLENIDTTKVFNETKSKTEVFIRRYKDNKGLISMADVAKMNAPVHEFAYGESRRKALTLYNRLFPEHEIGVPGVFRSIPLSFNDKVLETIKLKAPHMYQIIWDYAYELTVYKNFNRFCTIFKLVHELVNAEEPLIFRKKEITFQNILLSKEKTPLFTETEYRHAVIESGLFRRYGDVSLFTVELYNKMIAELQKTQFGKKLLERMTVTKFNGHATIAKEFKTCALPIDIEEVNTFFINNDYSLINVGKAALVEMLVAPLTDGLSIVGTRNHDNRVSITNVIDSF